jgi:DNA-binding PadR family transcriptional regulator
VYVDHALKSSELVSAPRGLLKIIIIELASKLPVSGVEIADRVKELSGGVWTPSPGSIYYLLKELVSKKRLSEIYTPDRGVKKYVATKKGLDELSLFRDFGEDILFKQATFMLLTAHLIPDESSMKTLSAYLSELRSRPKG